jgi:hypothetical protein
MCQAMHGASCTIDGDGDDADDRLAAVSPRPTPALTRSSDGAKIFRPPRLSRASDE